MAFRGKYTYMGRKRTANWASEEYRNEQNRKLKIAVRKCHYKKQYGITVEHYDEMFKKQNGCCAICKEPKLLDRNLAVDHCHNSKKVRGLLCQGCNMGLGFFKDDINLLSKAILYLNEHVR